MTSPGYLDTLDELLRPGIEGLSARFKAAQVRFVVSCQRSAGGFGGRQESSDLYFTDFALRTLAWLAPGHAAFVRTAGYLADLTGPPGNIAECFNLLNAHHLLEQHCPDIAENAGWKREPALLIEWLCAQRLPGGGFPRFPGDNRASAYHTFLGSLCFQLLGVEMPAIEDAIHAIEGLNRPDGGYAELADQTASQTNATAAAVGFLFMHNALMPETATPTSRFLAKMQSADGGLKPHGAVAGGDLLSTFSGLLTLSSLGGFHEIDTAGVARFLQRAAHPSGGFMACEGDDMPDVEYTYYGVGTLALLRVLADET
jgi:geranylgeranyl transferase type-2 subunit beta